jgi:predicted DCC family thiol-disulfide oxidoreductase YuxK
MTMRRFLLATMLLLLVPLVALEVLAGVLGRRPSRSRVAPGRPLLVYDDDCGLCTAAAIWLQLRVSGLELIGFSELPREGILESLDLGGLHASAHFVSADGVEYHGGEAITRVLRLVPGTEPIRYLDWPVLRGLREGGYRLVAWQRDRISRLIRAGLVL